MTLPTPPDLDPPAPTALVADAGAKAGPRVQQATEILRTAIISGRSKFSGEPSSADMLPPASCTMSSPAATSQMAMLVAQ